jgi:hypothetical protein
MAWVEILNEVTDGTEGDWSLCFQSCTYHYDDGTTEDGFRFIWRRPDGSLQAARGQARIPNAEALYELINAAKEEEWFD